MKKLLTLLIGISLAFTANAQKNNQMSDKQTFVHKASDKYEYPTDPEVLKKLEQWQDLKFGIMFHWGVYSVPGIAESWALCSEDRWFTQRREEARPEPSFLRRFQKMVLGIVGIF